MPKPAKGPRLGAGPAHQRMMLNQLAAQLFTHGSITTTQTKARRVQPVAERLISFAKRGDLAARRRVMRQILDKSVVHTLFTEIAPQLEEREGGYTRVIKTGFRKGDNAPLAVIELVLEPVQKKNSKNTAKTGEQTAKTDTVTGEQEESAVTDATEEAEETPEGVNADTEADDSPAEEAAASEKEAAAQEEDAKN